MPPRSSGLTGSSCWRWQTTVHPGRCSSMSLMIYGLSCSQTVSLYLRPSSRLGWRCLRTPPCSFAATATSCSRSRSTAPLERCSSMPQMPCVQSSTGTARSCCRPLGTSEQRCSRTPPWRSAETAGSCLRPRSAVHPGRCCSTLRTPCVQSSTQIAPSSCRPSGMWAQRRWSTPRQSFARTATSCLRRPATAPQARRCATRLGSSAPSSARTLPVRRRPGRSLALMGSAACRQRRTRTARPCPRLRRRLHLRSS
mmetsp:Transcript_94338/g.304642  ORF Transcript_94338/g.304642 Transcript_94338/m.304642 type:complete len:254 (+) Transcript_94338:383-1144(+)